MTETTETQPNETPIPSWLERRRQQLTDLALASESDRNARRNAVQDALRLSRGERLGEIVELADGVQVAEVEGGSFGTVWRPLHEGKPSLFGHADRWNAILAAVGRVFGTEDAAPYAARLLQVPQDEA